MINKLFSTLKELAMVFIGPFWQFLIRVFVKKYDKDGSISVAYMEKVNNAIPTFTVKLVDKILDIIYPPEEYVFGLCHSIWSSERFILALLLYKWYPPSDIYPDTFFD